MRNLVLVLALVWGLACAAGVASDLLQEALQDLQANYYGYSQVDFKALAREYQKELEAACAGQTECGADVAQRVIGNLVRSIGDGHTYYLSPERYKQAVSRFAGTPDGTPVFGITLTAFADGRVLIGDVRPRSAADQAGLRPYDRVEAVDGKPVLSLEDFRNRINTDQPLRMTVLRGQSERLQITLSRQPYNLPVLPTLYADGLPQGVFVLRIPDFAVYKQVGPRVHALVREAQAKGAKAIIVDLRNNSGGEETECESAPGAFVGNFTLEMRSRTHMVPFGYQDGAVLGNDPKDPNPPYVLDGATRFSGKVVALVNRSTASCGELMAYVLQQFGKIPLIGERTRGVMNTATEFWPLADGSAIAITYIRTFKTDGEALPLLVIPDIEMSYDPEAIARTGRDAMLERALEVLAQ